MIARVFPRRTEATPIDGLAFYGQPEMFIPEVSAIHISVTFTYDLDKAYKLAEMWETIAPVKIGGPATDMAGSDFTPGLYLKPGYVITSRGCNNRCWFCDVWKREGKIRELPITEGHDILDSNLLACSDEHIRKVFAMLERQPQRPRFTGGIDTKLLKEWHLEAFRSLKAKPIFYAYDTADDYEPLVEAAKSINRVYGKVDRRINNVYVLIGYKGDTYDHAEKRLGRVIELGMTPYAMLYRDRDGKVDKEWKRFQRVWIRPQIIYAITPELVVDVPGMYPRPGTWGYQ
jgi:hypothetical protein